jgi:hypothetical protein
MQLVKCVVWSPHGWNLSISLPLSFITLKYCLCILGGLMCFMPFVESCVAKAFQEDINTIISLPMLVDPHATFCNALTLLCLMHSLFIMYHTSIFRYFVALRWVWFLYHNYIGKVIGCGIFRHYNGSFGFSSRQFTYFFRGVCLYHSGLISCLYLLGTLGFDRSCNC